MDPCSRPVLPRTPRVRCALRLRPPSRRSCRHRLQPRISRSRVSPCDRSAYSGSKRHSRRHLRAAARVQVRCPGQHGRDAAPTRWRGGCRCIRFTAKRASPLEMLRDIDTLVIDLQDIGARIYTYIYTMANCLRARARHRIPVIVCDRPNPIGGVRSKVRASRRVRGLLGQFPIPMRHGMTTASPHLSSTSTSQSERRSRLPAWNDGTDMMRGRHWPAVGDAVPQHADTGRRCGLSGNRAVRGNQSVRGQGDDTAVRAGGGAVDRCRPVC